MTPHEELLVLQLHAKWGNRSGKLHMLYTRWSRIARKLPGRTDNEIKNYWTYMRKKTQEKKRTISPSSSLSNCSTSSPTSPTVDSLPIKDSNHRELSGTGGLDKLAAKGNKVELQEESEEGYCMDEIWNNIVLYDDESIKPVCGGYNKEVCDFSCPTIASPMWDYCPDSLWMTNQEESKLFLPTTQPFHSFFGQGNTF